MGNSRRKGAEGERELANLLTDLGHPCRRGQQYHGGPDSPDVVGLDGIHVECKRVQQLNVERAMAQSRGDAEGTGDLPVVMHRRDREAWKVTMDLSDWLLLYEAWRATVDAQRSGGGGTTS